MVAMGVMAQAVPDTTSTGCSAPISAGISQLAFPLMNSAPAAMTSFRNTPMGPTARNAIGAVTNNVINGLVKNFIIEGETFSANRSTWDMIQTVKMMGSTL